MGMNSYSVLSFLKTSVQSLFLNPVSVHCMFIWICCGLTCHGLILRDNISIYLEPLLVCTTVHCWRIFFVECHSPWCTWCDPSCYLTTGFWGVWCMNCFPVAPSTSHPSLAGQCLNILSLVPGVVCIFPISHSMTSSVTLVVTGGSSSNGKYPNSWPSFPGGSLMFSSISISLERVSAKMF